MRWDSVLLALTFAVSIHGVMFTSSTVRAQSDATDVEARRLFEEGRVAYEAARYDEAVVAFRRAYVRSPRYPLLYNIGQAELLAGHDAQALEAFESFLRQAPADDPRRAEVEERTRMLRSLGTQSPTTSATPTTTTTTAEPTTTEPTTTSTSTEEPVSAVATSSQSVTVVTGGGDEGPGIGPWIVVGVGGAALVAGAVLMGLGASEGDRVTNTPDNASWPELQSIASTAQTMWGVGIALIGVGVAAAGGGLVWALVGGGSSNEAQASLRLTPSSLSLEGTF